WRHRDLGMDHLDRRPRSAPHNADDGAAVHDRRRFHRAGADHHHLHAAGERADHRRPHQPGAHGRRADCDARLRPDHAALRARAADGLEIRGGQIFAGVTSGLADLWRVPDHHHFHHLLPGSRALDPEARPAAVGRLLPQPERRRRIHLPERVRCTGHDKAGHLARPYRFTRGRSAYSAACICGSAFSTRAAQNLNSGILPNGSSAGLVSLFAAASKKAKGMNTTPSGMASSCREFSSTMPRRVDTRTMSPGLMPSLSMVPRDSAAVGDGSMASRTVARRVMAPVCQCSSMRPVVRMNGYSWSGVSFGGWSFAATSLPKPPGRGKPLSNTTSWPGLSIASAG